jgi:hypothetical protein
LGKTQWARSLGRHTYWNGLVNLETFDKDSKYIIFDDFEFDFFPNKKQWWGSQKEFTATDKYKKKQTIQWGKPMIYLSNPDYDPRNHPKWSRWFSDNCIAIDIVNKLY